VSITGLVLAKAAGATTIITSSSDEKLRYVKEKYQADHVINYKKTPDWASEVQTITSGRGVDLSSVSWGRNLGKGTEFRWVTSHGCGSREFSPQ
jgi:NADPH:quinone reductase-like Zn-dependent oxidoreductase